MSRTWSALDSVGWGLGDALAGPDIDWEGFGDAVVVAVEAVGGGGGDGGGFGAFLDGIWVLLTFGAFFGLAIMGRGY